MSNVKIFKHELAGQPLEVEVGKLANQAQGACTVRYGDTVVLATVVQASTPREGIDYFPLMVDYEERLYAAGKIKGSRFIKREGRPTDEAILTARVIDRSVRPLFGDSERRDVQVMVTVLSVDGENDPDVPSLLAASLALAISPVKWSGPIAAGRVGRVDGQWVFNPSYEARSKSDLDVFISATAEEIVMLEAGSQEVVEADMSAAITFGHQQIAKLFPFMQEVIQACAQPKLAEIEISTELKEQQAKLKAKVEQYLNGKFDSLFGGSSKQSFKDGLRQIEQGLSEALKADNEVSKEEAGRGLKLIEFYLDKASRQYVLATGKRVDGRAFDQIRSLSAEVGLLPRTHGSGLFQRGETQVLSVVTLGSPGDEQTLDGMEEDGKKRYMHHYNFPAYSVGEVKPIRSPGRREIGHGALAEKALMPVIPQDKEKFPYTIRVVSEVLSSNGSSSQASICGSSLALMDAGVPISAPVAGIAMGLITDLDQPTKYAILTDIQGIEDHSGDMDFKVGGTTKGITAVQLDIKLGGISLAIVEETLNKAKEARLQILEVMSKALAQPRPEMSPYAPRIISFYIPVDKIRDVIGPGGKMINEIIAVTGVAIDIEDSGLVMVTSNNASGSAQAVDWIKNLTRQVVVGEVYKGKVTRLMNFGAFVEILPRTEGLVHISELAWARINTVQEAVNVGDEIEVKVTEIDDQGRVNLSHKQLLPKPEGYVASAETAYQPARNSRPFAGGRGRESQGHGSRR
ncbi:polyribonucleotide nucleotidyltransferase [Patescibacteria group bacterium]|nr:polyribonucleotide nucleotidyltransferase [Patescibacteria group bacterium]